MGSFFPVRIPKTVRFANDYSNPDDQYATLYSARVLEIIRSLGLPRHGLGNYVFLHAIRNGLPLPLGYRNAEMPDSWFTDRDSDQPDGFLFDGEAVETDENV